jgi:hypothetical protein
VVPNATLMGMVEGHINAGQLKEAEQIIKRFG